MVNPILHVNKAFKEQVQKCMSDKFDTNTKSHIENIMEKRIPLF